MPYPFANATAGATATPINAFAFSEVGELSKELLRLEWNPTPEEVAIIKQNIGHEIYDIVWNLCDLATQLEIDLETAFAEKRAYNEKRWG